MMLDLECLTDSRRRSLDDIFHEEENRTEDGKYWGRLVTKITLNPKKWGIEGEVDSKTLWGAELVISSECEDVELESKPIGWAR